jgi:TolB-like protein/tetratricopeptide (TPR) repeat protein
VSALLRDLSRVPELEIGSGWNRVLKPGAVIGRFELVRELGRGGFGVVYEARDQDLGRKVAFKAVRAGGRLEIREERLLREAEAAARLSHPNIVTLFDVGRSEQGPYLILELLRGRTLVQRLDEGRLPLLEALHIAVEVAKGVAHAHGNGVVHRDLTPGNVYLCDDGRVKVLDLGMAYAFGRPCVEGGTPGYMAPEQRRGAPEDERTDVFALGVILHRMLTGELPFDEGTGEPRSAAPVLDVPGAPELGDLIARMLAQDPARRPRNGTDVVVALTPFLQEIERTPADGMRMATGRRSGPRLRVAVMVLAAVLATGVAGGWAAVRGTASGPGAALATRLAPSIAVLPFVDLSPTKDEDYFSDGLADEILGALARVEGLRVPSRASSFFFKGKPAKLADIGRELNVGAVLEGSVRKAGNRVRVTADIVRVADGSRLWSHSYDRELSDVFAVQDDIVGAVVAALDVKVVDGKTPSTLVVATDDPEAYRQYLIGRHQNRRFTSESLRLSVAAFERAIALKPGYAPAWAGLAEPLYFVALQEKTAAAVAARRQRALTAAEKAVELAPGLPEALSTRALLRAAVKYDWNGAKADLERALAVNGKDGDTRRRYATLLANLGRLPEAIQEARKATEIDPLSSSWSKLGLLYQAAGELDLAEAAFKRDLEVWPESVAGLFGLGRTLVLASKPKEALEAFARCADEDDRLWGKAIAEHSLGNAAASQRALEALAARYAHTGASDIAAIHAWRGEKDEAFKWLERALEQHDAGMVGFRTDPFFRSLRGDARFAALLRRMKLPVE